MRRICRTNARSVGERASIRAFLSTLTKPGSPGLFICAKLSLIARAGGRLVTKRAEQAAAIETATQVAHEQLDAALQALDYAGALDLQIQVDRLRRQAQQIRRRRWWQAAEY